VIDLLVDFEAAKHGLLPLAGFASDVRAIIERAVDATTVDLVRDEVPKKALAESGAAMTKQR
jgi:predicted nucleotidyltransferase